MPTILYCAWDEKVTFKIGSNRRYMRDTAASENCTFFGNFFLHTYLLIINELSQNNCALFAQGAIYLLDFTD